MDLSEFKRLPLLGILRGGDAEIVEPLVETVLEAGLKTIEITMNTPGAGEMIQRAQAAGKGRLTVGAGTVLTLDDLQAAVQAGATFVVMPVLVAEVVVECRRLGVPVFPGALTPQEIFNAWRAGATMVKVFPARFFGPAYFDEIKGPFREIELMAVGGVSAANAAAVFASGASAVAFGASVFRPEWLETRQLSRIGERVRELVGVVCAASGAGVSRLR